MNIVLFVNASIGFSENLFLVTKLSVFYKIRNNFTVDRTLKIFEWFQFSDYELYKEFYYKIPARHSFHV